MVWLLIEICPIWWLQLATCDTVQLGLHHVPAGSLVIRPALFGLSTNFKLSDVVPLATVGATPKRPAARNAVVDAIMICDGHTDNCC